MITRIVDDKGRISLDSELAGVFKNNSAYLRYNSGDNEIFVMSSDAIRELATEIEQKYGKHLMGNTLARNAMRKLSGRTYSSKIQEANRLVIPPQIRGIAGINYGDVLEARADGKRVILKKAS